MRCTACNSESKSKSNKPLSPSRSTGEDLCLLLCLDLWDRQMQAGRQANAGQWGSTDPTLLIDRAKVARKAAFRT